MKFGPRTPSLKRSLAARTSWKRFARHSLKLKAPRGFGWFTNPKRAAYNRVYYRTTFRVIHWPRGPRGVIAQALSVLLFGLFHRRG